MVQKGEQWIGWTLHANVYVLNHLLRARVIYWHTFDTRAISKRFSFIHTYFTHIANQMIMIQSINCAKLMNFKLKNYSLNIQLGDPHLLDSAAVLRRAQLITQTTTIYHLIECF